MPTLHEHSWRWDGDDPYVKCGCGEIRDALNGRVIVRGAVRPPDREAIERAKTETGVEGLAPGSLSAVPPPEETT